MSNWFRLTGSRVYLLVLTGLALWFLRKVGVNVNTIAPGIVVSLLAWAFWWHWVYAFAPVTPRPATPSGGRISRAGLIATITVVSLVVTAIAWVWPSGIDFVFGEWGVEGLRLLGLFLWLLCVPCMCLGAFQYWVSTPKPIRRAVGWRGWFS